MPVLSATRTRDGVLRVAPMAWKNTNNRQTRFPGHRVHGHVHFIDNAHYWRSVMAGSVEITLVVHSVGDAMRAVVFVAGPHFEGYLDVNYYRMRITPLSEDVVPCATLFPDVRADGLRYNVYLTMDGRTPAICRSYCLPKGLQQRTIDYPTYYDREMVTIREDDGYYTTYTVRIKSNDRIKVWRRHPLSIGYTDEVIYRGYIDDYADYCPDYYYVPNGSSSILDSYQLAIGLEITPDGLFVGAHGVEIPARGTAGRIHAVVDRGMILQTNGASLHITDRNLTCRECSIFDYRGICHYSTYRCQGFDRKMLRLVPGVYHEIVVKMGVASVYYLTYAPDEPATKVAIIQYTKHPRAERDPLYWFGHIPRDIVEIINEYIDFGEWTLVYNGDR